MTDNRFFQERYEALCAVKDTHPEMPMPLYYSIVVTAANAIFLHDNSKDNLCLFSASLFLLDSAEAVLQKWLDDPSTWSEPVGRS